MTSDPPADLSFALRLADVADAITAIRIGAPGEVARKADGSPVTAVDAEVEDALLAIVESERPADGYLGEEVGAARAGRRRSR